MAGVYAFATLGPNLYDENSALVTRVAFGVEGPTRASELCGCAARNGRVAQNAERGGRSSPCLCIQWEENEPPNACTAEARGWAISSAMGLLHTVTVYQKKRCVCRSGPIRGVSFEIKISAKELLL